MDECTYGRLFGDCQTSQGVFKLIKIPSEGERTSLINPSQEEEHKKAVDAVHCDAYVDGQLIHLVVDTGSTGSLISKSFLDKLGRTIEAPSNINLVDVNGGKRRSLGKIKNLPINIKGTIIPINVDVSEAANYSVIVEND